MSKKLKLVFKDSLGKTSTLAPAISDVLLDAEVVENSMQAISALELFEKDAVLKYATPVSANYTETIVTPIF
ncbi:DUF2922 domain-containing protein [Enterococcus timonensis]|uniref:DUF2922 domain-containing protein n=1 Tax=Enterococcus timonensis TaxID=1852364 RepID=UPI0008DAD703|nr:DUF2922 domain-containing protein [Enterococcus timonensis]